MLDSVSTRFWKSVNYMNFTKQPRLSTSPTCRLAAHSFHRRLLPDEALFLPGKKPVLTEAGEYLLHAFSTLSHDQVYLKEQVLAMKNKHPSYLRSDPHHRGVRHAAVFD